MPIYEYRCQHCGHELEKLQRMSDDPLKDCPNCEQPELKRLISAAGFRLKGSGWYETDFKQGQKKNLVDNGDSAGKGKSDAKADSPSDSGGSNATAAKETPKAGESKPASPASSA